MSSRVPSFLLGGINLTFNLIGLRTIRTSVYGAGETLLKISPVVLLFGAASAHQSATIEDVLNVETPAPAPERRTSLTQ